MEGNLQITVSDGNNRYFMDESTWIQSAQPQLNRINGRSSAKKRATILALLTAELLDRPMEWTRADVCAKSTWYDHWQHDELVQDVMAKVRASIVEARSETAVLAVTEALNVIQSAAPDAAKKLVKLLDSENDNVVRLAADSILSRASEFTAEKSGAGSTFTADQLAQMSKTASSELAQWEVEQGEQPFEI